MPWHSVNLGLLLWRPWNWPNIFLVTTHQLSCNFGIHILHNEQTCCCSVKEIPQFIIGYASKGTATSITWTCHKNCDCCRLSCGICSIKQIHCGLIKIYLPLFLLIIGMQTHTLIQNQKHQGSPVPRRVTLSTMCLGMTTNCLESQTRRLLQLILSSDIWSEIVEVEIK